MAKKKKDSGSSGRMATTVALSGGVFLLRKLLGTGWTKITGKEPPTDLSDPKVTLVEALAWSIATGIVVETLRFYVLHTKTKRSLTEAEAESS
jgi:hypothetical protein